MSSPPGKLGDGQPRLAVDAREGEALGGDDLDLDPRRIDAGILDDGEERRLADVAERGERDDVDAGGGDDPRGALVGGEHDVARVGADGHAVGDAGGEVEDGQLLVAAGALLLGAVDVVVDEHVLAAGADGEVVGAGGDLVDLDGGGAGLAGAQDGDVVAALIEDDDAAGVARLPGDRLDDGRALADLDDVDDEVRGVDDRDRVGRLAGAVDVLAAGPRDAKITVVLGLGRGRFAGRGAVGGADAVAVAGVRAAVGGAVAVVPAGELVRGAGGQAGGETQGQRPRRSQRLHEQLQVPVRSRQGKGKEPRC
ncbi:hypothetical protein OV079_09145 [Nannocystis pusilla]|uniref:Uncharacterized protein n=1 Tax=Nannocystis pusilla TaxID=889268 RepID=A0A9X3IVT5_9BACT|nr:hypothetical protein [Nannocystis pusilla]MCY1005726.1 hypothetical protein [Nannocystis pusilla]